MNVGFIHGVMNTDNMTISGETIDYGPCAFMDAYDPATVFSSIDHGGRYAYGNQPAIAQWNLARLAETLLPLLDDDPDAAIAAATDVLRVLPRPLRALPAATACAPSSGLADGAPEDGELVDDLLALLQAQRVDFTSFFRALSAAARGDAAPVRALFGEPAAFDAWAERWRERLATGRPRRAAGDRRRDGPRQPASTSRATTWSRRRWRPRPTATSAPFERLVDVLAAAVRRAPRARGATPRRRPRASASATRRSAAPDAGVSRGAQPPAFSPPGGPNQVVSASGEPAVGFGLRPRRRSRRAGSTRRWER